MVHALTENRNGLVVAAELTLATGTAECEAASTMIGALGLDAEKGEKRRGSRLERVRR